MESYEPAMVPLKKGGVRVRDSSVMPAKHGFSQIKSMFYGNREPILQDNNPQNTGRQF